MVTDGLKPHPRIATLGLCPNCDKPLARVDPPRAQCPFCKSELIKVAHQPASTTLPKVDLQSSVPAEKESPASVPPIVSDDTAPSHPSSTQSIQDGSFSRNYYCPTCKKLDSTGWTHCLDCGTQLIPEAEYKEIRAVNDPILIKRKISLTQWGLIIQKMAAPVGIGVFLYMMFSNGILHFPQKSVSSEEAMPVTPWELVQAHEANEIGADQKYKGKIVQFSGRVADFKRDIGNDRFYITFELSHDFGPGFAGGFAEGYMAVKNPQCFFTNQYTSQLASLTKGQMLTVRGRLVEFGPLGNAVINDCIIVQ